MAWFKVDDKLHASRKVMKIPRRHRMAALGLWTIAGSWCADQETDGVVPDYMIEEWGGTTLLVDQLVSVGLWVQLDRNSGTTGSQLDCNWQFHDWAEYQPTRAQLEDGRRKNAEKLRKWRGRNANVTDGVTGLQDGSNHDRNGAPDPTRPDPTPIKEASLLKGDENEVSRSVRIPKDWAPNAQHIDRARANGIDVLDEAENFKLHAETHDRRAKNWNAAFTTWLKKSKPVTPKSDPDAWMNRSRREAPEW